MEVYPQTLISLKVREKRDLGEIPQIMQGIREAEHRLGDRGRLLIRYSGTEPKIRVMCEGEDAAEVEALAQEIAALIQENLGVEE